MSSVTKKTSRSSSSSSSKTGSGSRSSSKPSSKSGKQIKSSSSQGGSKDEWTEWAWDENYQRHYRGRLLENGEWEYQYRNPEQDKIPAKEIPRSLDLGSVQEELEDESSASAIPSQNQLPSSLSEGGAHYTTTTSYQPASEMQSLSRGVSNIQLNSNRAIGDTQDFGGFSTGPRFPFPQGSRNPSTLLYSTTPSFTGSQYMVAPSLNVSSMTAPMFTEQMGTTNQPSIQRRLPDSADTEEAARRISNWTEESAIPDEATTLNKQYKLHHSDHFKRARVFRILWTEPKGQGRPGNQKRTDPMLTTRYGEEYYSSIRRFVIAIEKEGHCLCVPILTYQNQGTTKPGVKPQDHAIIYTESKERKAQIPKEIPGEEKLHNRPIRMEPKTPRDQLSKFSRLNYAKIYTVEHNVKVCFIGHIHKNSMQDFSKSYNRQNPAMPEDDDIEFEDNAEGDEHESEERVTEAPDSWQSRDPVSQSEEMAPGEL